MVKIRIVNTNTNIHFETTCDNLYNYFTECHRLLGLKTIKEVDDIYNTFKQQGQVTFNYRMYGYDMCISCMRI